MIIIIVFLIVYAFQESPLTGNITTNLQQIANLTYYLQLIHK